MIKKNSAPESAINQIGRNYINLLIIAATFPEAVLLLALILSEVAHGR